jgi:hypothetical protein
MGVAATSLRVGARERSGDTEPPGLHNHRPAAGRLYYRQAVELVELGATCSVTVGTRYVLPTPPVSSASTTADARPQSAAG